MLEISPREHTKIFDVDELKQRTRWHIWITLFIERAVGNMVPAFTRLCSCWRQTFWAYAVNMMWLTTSLTIFETIGLAFSCFLLYNDSLKGTYKYCVDGSIYHLKYPRVVLAHISGKVGTLCTVSLSVYFRTILPISFIEIGLTNTKHK